MPTASPTILSAAYDFFFQRLRRRILTFRLTITKGLVILPQKAGQEYKALTFSLFLFFLKEIIVRLRYSVLSCISASPVQIRNRRKQVEDGKVTKNSNHDLILSDES